MFIHHIRCQILCLFCLWPFVALADSVVDLSATMPKVIDKNLGRNFGILVGDIIHHEYTVMVVDNTTLNESTLPRVGSLSYWLELVNVAHTVRKSKGYAIYTLSFDYQTFYASLDVHHLEIPEQEISFYNNGNTSTLTLPLWPFISSPIKELTASRDYDGRFMQADIAPQKVNLATERQRIYLAIIALILVMALWCWLAGYLPGRSSSPFHKARQAIKRLNRKGALNDELVEACIQAVHTAFNTRAKQVVFAHKINEFIDQHQQFALVRNEINDFFVLSQEIVFLNKEVSGDIVPQLIRLCEQLAAVDNIVK